MKYKQYQKLICTENYVMDDGDVTFTAGRKYMIDRIDRYIWFYNDQSNYHALPVSDVDKHFKSPESVSDAYKRAMKVLG